MNKQSRECWNCKYCGVDMDMDSYCKHPQVTKKFSSGLVLHSPRLTQFCPSPNRPLFEFYKPALRRIYVASSWRNEQQQSVVAKLRVAGHEVYDFKNPPNATGFAWREIDPNWQQWTAAQQVASYDHPRSVEGFKSDFDAMKWADTCVMVQPCGRSAALELGWAVGAGKKTFVLMAEGQEPELMLRLADHLCLSIEEIIERLK
jgi:hypothetical protein